MAKSTINRFDRLSEFIKTQVEEKGSAAIAKEVEDLMIEKNLIHGPSLTEVIESITPNNTGENIMTESHAPTNEPVVG